MEAAILLGLQSLRVGGLDALLALVSALGNGALVWVVLAIVMFFLPERRATAFYMVASIIVTAIVCELVIGPLVGRVRPCDAGIGVTAVFGVSHPGYSFPSFHAASSFASATAMALTLGRRASTGAYIGAALIAFTRLYLGVHYPTDVIAGAVLGIVLAFVVVWVVNQFFGTKLGNASQQRERPQGKRRSL